ncbi:helix-turn-helix transcriptional regulator, partial [uncultured Deinococcus sp.]
MKLHERLRELRSERGLRLKDVAETAGISVPYLSDLER